MRLLDERDVLVHPGYFFDFPREAFLVLSLLTPEDDFAEGTARVLADLAREARQGCGRGRAITRAGAPSHDVQACRAPRGLETAAGPAVRAPAGVIVTGATGALGSAVVRRTAGPGRARRGALSRRQRLARLARRGTAARRRARPAAGDRGRARLAPPAPPASSTPPRCALGRLDGVALVAGGWQGGARFEDAPDGRVAAMLRQNLDTAANVCRAALPHLLRGGRQRRGRRLAGGRDRRRGHGGLRRLEVGAARARARARAREPRARRALQRGAAGHDRHPGEPARRCPTRTARPGRRPRRSRARSRSCSRRTRAPVTRRARARRRAGLRLSETAPRARRSE